LSIETQDSRSSSSRQHSSSRRSSSFSGRAPVRSTSVSGYMTAAAATSAALFFILWWMLQGEESPWIPAGLAASVVMLVAASALILVAKRARSQNRHRSESGQWRQPNQERSVKAMHSTSMHAATLRRLQQQSAEADAKDAPEVHRELYDFCTQYLTSAQQALLSPSLSAEGRVALRAGLERVRNLQKHHLLAWTRGSAGNFMHDAQQRARLFEKVEAANRALDCIDSALKSYPDEDELNRSAKAVREFISSSRVAHWVELAERAAFKGQYQRAIDCYCDALYYLTRDNPDAAHEATGERITREVDLLRARLSTHEVILTPAEPGSRSGNE
jgi:tetratricopeptide (TPR) repeat protein